MSTIVGNLQQGLAFILGAPSRQIHYPVPVHLQLAAHHLGYKRGDLPVTEKQSQSILSLPIYPELSRENLEYIVRLIEEFYQSEKVIL